MCVAAAVFGVQDEERGTMCSNSQCWGCIIGVSLSELHTSGLAGVVAV